MQQPDYEVPWTPDEKLKCDSKEHGLPLGSVLGWEGTRSELCINVKAQTRSKNPVSWGNKPSQEGNLISNGAGNSSISSGIS